MAMHHTTKSQTVFKGKIQIWEDGSPKPKIDVASLRSVMRLEIINKGGSQLEKSIQNL